MSYDAMLDAMKSNPELAREIHDAPTVSHREAILDKHGIDKPRSAAHSPQRSR